MNEKLVALLETVINRIPWPTQEAHNEALNLLREFQDDLGVTIVGPPPGATEAPPDAATAAADQPTPPLDTDALVAAGWTPPASPEVATEQPEAANAFADTAPPAGDVAGT